MPLTKGLSRGIIYVRLFVGLVLHDVCWRGYVSIR